MAYPKHLSGSWHFSGDWLGSYRLIATNQELGDPDVDCINGKWQTNLVCPNCGHPEGVVLSRFHRTFPLCRWCPACEIVWQWYVARCPDCGWYVWKKDCPDGMVICTGCGMEMEVEFVQEINEDPEFGNEVEE